MAIDTAVKRASAATVMVPFPPSVVANGSIDAADRQHSAWSYAGILADNPIASTTIRIPSIPTMPTIPSMHVRGW